MGQTVRDQLDGVPRKTLKVGIPTDADTLKPVENPGELIVLALNQIGMSQKEAAIVMGIAEPQLTRQLRGDEHLSWQRLFKLDDAFWRALWVLLAKRRKLARVRQRITFDFEVA